MLNNSNHLQFREHKSVDRYQMSISRITNDMWDEILQLQAEVYLDGLAEEREVLKNKWELSPDYCFVYMQQGKINSYLLSHSWCSDTPPKLFEILPNNTNGSTLFIHDLAVSNRAKGGGVGKLMVERLLGISKERQFKKLLLVSVQDSVKFWSKMGFKEVEQHNVNSSYGSDAKLMSLEMEA